MKDNMFVPSQACKANNQTSSTHDQGELEQKKRKAMPFKFIWDSEYCMKGTKLIQIYTTVPTDQLIQPQFNSPLLKIPAGNRTVALSKWVIGHW
jgi:hypothetical protein